MKLTHAPLLLVEDDANDVLLVQRALRRAGIDVEMRVVSSGKEAVSYLSGEGKYADRAAHPLPVLVLLDLKLPLQSGLEVLAWIKAAPLLRSLPVIVLSSSKQFDDVNRAYAAGANSYLVKPVAFDALQKMLTTFGHYWLNFNTPPDVSSAKADRTAHSGREQRD